MEAVILGVGSGLPQVDRNLSALLVKHDGVTILADCGDGTTKLLQQRGVAADDLEAVFITHYHPDHLSGIFMLIQWMYLEGRTKPLLLFLPERPAAFVEMMQLMYTFQQKFSFKLQVLEMSQTELYYDWISTTPTDHLHGYAAIIREHSLSNQMQSWSIKFSSEQGDLVYSSDLGTTDSIAGFIKGVHTIIVDAGHPVAEQILKLRYAEIGRVILTHGISPSLELQKHLLSEAPFELARESFSYYV